METKKIKIAILGDENVGKTSLINCLNGKKLHEVTTSPTSYASFQTYHYKEYEFKIWDVSGNESCRNLCSLYLQDTKIIILMFDLSEEKTYENIHTTNQNIESWIDTITCHSNTDRYVIVIGNKSDDKQYNVNFDLIQKKLFSNANIKDVNYIELSLYDNIDILRNQMIMYAEDIVPQKEKQHVSKSKCIIL